MNLEKTFFMIKPEGLKYENCIEDIILKNGFDIVYSDYLILSGEDIDLIYASTEDPNIFCIHKSYMINKRVKAGVLEGVDVINRFMSLCGLLPNPLDCSNNSIRYHFGAEPLLVDGLTYYRNSIHRSSSKNDASNEVGYFFENVCI